MHDRRRWVRPTGSFWVGLWVGVWVSLLKGRPIDLPVFRWVWTYPDLSGPTEILYVVFNAVGLSFGATIPRHGRPSSGVSGARSCSFI